MQCLRWHRLLAQSSALSLRIFRPQIERHDFTISRHENPANPDPCAFPGSGRRRRAAVRNRRTRFARPLDADGSGSRQCSGQTRLSTCRRQAVVGGDRAHDPARLVVEIDGAILQTQTDDPVSLLIVDFRAPDACAPMRFDKQR